MFEFCKISEIYDLDFEQTFSNVHLFQIIENYREVEVETCLARCNGNPFFPEFVMNYGALIGFLDLLRLSVDDWLGVCMQRVSGGGGKGSGRSRKTWEQCVRDDMKLLGLHSEWAIFKDMWRDLIWGKRLTLA